MANRRPFFLVLLALLVAVPARVLADESALPKPGDIATLFFISKDENRNQVHYGLHVDAKCVPRPKEPVFAYWRDLEVGPNELNTFKMIEYRPYGILSQHVVPNAAGTGTVDLYLRSLPTRAIRIDVSRDPKGACVARTRMFIGGKRAELKSAYIEVGMLSIKSLTLRGVSSRDNSAVTEVIKP